MSAEKLLTAALGHAGHAYICIDVHGNAESQSSTLEKASVSVKTLQIQDRTSQAYALSHHAAWQPLRNTSFGQK